MQTFLPYESFILSARTLDRQRLGKQRVEALQMLKALSGETRGWVNHPATRMWRNCEWSLLLYGEAVCAVWSSRGYRDSCAAKMRHLSRVHGADWGDEYPSWLGDDEFHLSHRSNLVRKAPAFYGPLWPGVDPGMPYKWPV